MKTRRMSYEDYKVGYEEFVEEQVDGFDDYFDDIYNGKVRSKCYNSMFDIIDSFDTLPLYYM